MKKVLKGVACTAVIFAALICLCAWLDMNDIPSRMGIPVHLINWDAAGVVGGNLIVVALFAITYIALDKRSIQKEHNRHRVAIYLIHQAIVLCKSQLPLLKNDVFMSSLVDDINPDQSINENPPTHRLLSMPFEDHEAIITFAAEGVISEEELKAYYMVKGAHMALISTFTMSLSDDETKKNVETVFEATVELAEAVLKMQREENA